MYEEPLKRKNNTLVCNSCESGNPLLQTLTSFWIPALERKKLFSTQTKPRNGVRGYQLYRGTVNFVREQPLSTSMVRRDHTLNP